MILATQEYLGDKQRKRTRSGGVRILPSSTIAVGKYVLLKYPDRPPNKLAGLYRGPLLVVSKERDDIVELLDLISNKKFHAHMDRIMPFTTSPEVSQSQLLELAGIDLDEFVVDFIVDHRENGRNHRDWEFLVRWNGYEPTEDTWLPWSEVRNLAALDVYSQAHPELNLG